MDSLTLIAEARAAGLTVTAVGGRMVIRGPRRAAAIRGLEVDLGRQLTIIALCLQNVHIVENWPMTRMSVLEARQNLAETINRVRYQHERIVLERHGKGVAVLIPLDDLALIEQLEDRQDVAEAEKALAEAKAKKETPIPWAKAKKQLGV